MTTRTQAIDALVTTINNIGIKCITTELNADSFAIRPLCVVDDSKPENRKSFTYGYTDIELEVALKTRVKKETGLDIGVTASNADRLIINALTNNPTFLGVISGVQIGGRSELKRSESGAFFTLNRAITLFFTDQIGG